MVWLHPTSWLHNMSPISFYCVSCFAFLPYFLLAPQRKSGSDVTAFKFKNNKIGSWINAGHVCNYWLDSDSPKVEHSLDPLHGNTALCKSLHEKCLHLDFDKPYFWRTSKFRVCIASIKFFESLDHIGPTEIYYSAILFKVSLLSWFFNYSVFHHGLLEITAKF